MGLQKAVVVVVVVRLASVVSNNLSFSVLH